MNFQGDICIIGNGAIGKAAALACAQAGWKVCLLKPPGTEPVAPVGGWDARVYALNRTAHELLSSIRVWNAMDASRIASVDAMAIHGDSTQAGRLDFDAYGARASELAWIVEDANLNRALDAALQFASNLEVTAGRALRFESGTRSGTANTVHLDNGDALTAALVVGADGAQSWVRHQCDIDIDYRSYGQRAIVANFDSEKPHRGIARQWFTAEEGIIALLPLPGQRVSLVWSAPEALAEILLARSAADLAERLATYAADELGRLHPMPPETVRSFPLSLIRPHAIIAPRVALIGDAAHVIHPLAGHGMNLGFGDVAGLLQAIGQREDGADCGAEERLRRYARLRKEDILMMQLATDGLHRLFSTELEPVRVLRNLGLNLVNRLPVIKRRLISQALGKPH